MQTRPQPGQSDLKFDNMTREDLKKIEKSMKRPEFMGLLNEYMLEISDPKNKKEYDDYLKQMESEHELPKHMKIVELKPKFCFRTFIVSQKNKNHEMKFFVNMCESQFLEKPSCEPSPGEDGKVGYSWKVPNSMGKIRYDQDKHGNPCQVVDIAFHPDTYFFAVKKQFQEMMINIALEAAEKQLGERKETLSRDYIVLKKLICKGQDGKPALLPIRYIEGKMYNKGEGPNEEPERDSEGRETKLQKEINKQKDQHDKTKKGGKVQKQEEQKEEDIEETKPLVQDMEKGVQRPTYRALPTYSVDYSEFIDDPAAAKKHKIPKTFSVIFNIPRVQSMQELATQTLQINDKKIVLKIGEIYFIDLQFSQFNLKYVLLTANAKAKYDKKQKTLKIEIPVDQTLPYPENESAEPAKAEEQISNDKIVEHQTWKNKVLDFSDPNISVCQLSQEERKEEGPKLVEEIEEQDQLPETKTKKEEELAEQEEQNNDNQVLQAKKFSINSYYQGTRVEKGHQRIGYHFQETKDFVVLLIRTKGSAREDITTFVSEDNRQFLIQWGYASKFQHIKLNESFGQKVEKVEVLKRIGATLFVITKKIGEISQLWGKIAVYPAFYQEENQQTVYTQFKQYLTNQLQSAEKKQIQESLREQPIPEPSNQKQTTNIQSSNDNENLQQGNEIIERPPQKQQQETVRQQKQQPNIFSNLQPQFILFTAQFIDILD